MITRGARLRQAKMGEYILVNGRHFKLGTCQDLFYVSFDGLRRMVAAGAQPAPANDEPAEYLNEAGKWRYRFPWPDEDGIGDDYERALPLPVPGGLATALTAGWEHWKVRYTPPAGVEFGDDCPQASAPAVVEVYLQKQIEGRLWLIIRCPYCHALARLPEAEAIELTDHARRELADDAFVMAVCDRIEAGYQVQL